MLLPLLLTLSARQVPLYIGTYTSEHGSKGIYRVELDTETGQLSQPRLAAETTAPSYIALHPSGRYLYAVNENSGGDVVSFAVQRDGMLHHLNTVSWKGGGPCHVSVDHAGKHVFAAAYGGGSFACFPVLGDGSLGTASSVFQNAGAGPDKSRQEGPHAHGIYPGPGDRFVYACDLGTDEVLSFRFDSKRGHMMLAEPRSVHPSAGGGPRHLAFHPSHKYVFVNNEMGNSVTSFSVNGESGALTPVQTVSTLPLEGSFKGNTTAEIECHPSGKWLYVSNRGHDSIAVFEVLDGGKLRFLALEPSLVHIPRGFGIDSTGEWLVVAGQDSNDLVSFAIGKDGYLKPTGSRVKVDKPVCVLLGR